MPPLDIATNDVLLGSAQCRLLWRLGLLNIDLGNDATVLWIDERDIVAFYEVLILCN